MISNAVEINMYDCSIKIRLLDMKCSQNLQSRLLAWGGGGELLVLPTFFLCLYRRIPTANYSISYPTFVHRAVVYYIHLLTLRRIAIL